MQISWINPQQFKALTAQTGTASAEVLGGTSVRDVSSAEAEAKRMDSEQRWVADMRKRSQEGVTISPADQPGEVNLTAVRYLEKAAEMKVALAKLQNAAAEPDTMDTILQVLEGKEPALDSMAGYIAQRIAQGGAEGFTFALKFESMDLETGSDHDAVSLHKERILGVRTGDGADAVSLRGKRIHDVHTDRDIAVTATISGHGRSNSWRETKTHANADSLSIVGQDVGFIQTGGGDDAIAIRSELLQAVNAGDGNDAVSVAAEYVRGIDGGAGDDQMFVSASVFRGVQGGQGNDRISVTADRAAYRSNPYQAADASISAAARTPAQRLADAARHKVNVDGGTGDDQIHLKVASEVAVSGGAGDDTFFIDGGTVALKEPAQGHDIVELANGAEVVLVADQTTGYAVEQGENSMKITFDNGSSVTFRNLDQAGAIGIGGWEITMLHQGASLDATV